jgi:hypothetical protein
MANRLRLPASDNTPEALAQLRHANLVYRGLPWSRPFVPGPGFVSTQRAHRPVNCGLRFAMKAVRPSV